jgi:Tol biopolymer transport system component
VTASLDRLTVALADRYRVERELGQGGMATVFLAHDLRHHRQVALKVLRPELAAVIGADRFLHEITTTANLQHPHILPLHDSGTVDGTVFYVMPFIEGESLRDRLHREKQLPVEDAVRIAREVASALDYAHRHGVIHRDIKPENILLHDGSALVADFGIALAASRTGGSRMTETGMSLGTPHYMSPEQAMGERELTARSDVYALGCVLYEMLAGEPPFTGPTPQAIVARVVTEEPRSLSLQRKTIPPHIEASVQRALQKLPADRFATAADFAEALVDSSAVGRTEYLSHRHTAALPIRRSATLPLFGVAVLATVAAMWGWLGRPSAPAGRVTRVHMALPAGQALSGAYGQRFAFSNDGSHLAYVGESPEGGRQIWIRPLNALEGRALAGTQGAMAPVFSPDGAWLAFVADGKLRKVPVAGGPVVTVADSANQVIAGAAWLADGTIVFTHDNWRFYRVSQDGGQATRMPPIKTVGAILPRALPRSDAVLYSTCDNACLRMTVGALDLTSGKVIQLADEATGAWYAPTGHVVYLRRDGAVFQVPFDLDALEARGPAVPLFDGVHVVGGMIASFALSPEGSLLYLSGNALRAGEIVRVDRAGHVTVVDPAWPPALVFSSALSPDGTRLALEVSEGQRNDIWVKELDRGALTRLTFDGIRNHRPSWTDDGQRVSYITADSVWSIRSQRPDGTGDVSRIVPPDSLGEPEGHAWSPDGAWLVLQTRKSGRRDLYALKVGTDSVLPVAASSGADEMAPALSPDGRWIAYTSTETGRAEVYLRPFPNVGMERRQITNRGGRSPEWSANGRELFFMAESQELFVADVTPGPRPLIGEPRTVFSTRGFWMNAFYRGYHLEPGGRSFIMYRAFTTDAQSQFVLVLNWLEELRAKARR